MAVETITRTAADNVYLHRDFHCALNAALEYLRVNYDDAAVREYLRRFAQTYHAPLRADLRRRGLPALREHFDRIYRLEGGSYRLTCDDRELRLEVASCPAVAHIRRRGETPGPAFIETELAVNAAICEGTPFVFRLERYDPDTGAGLRVFALREQP